MAHALATSGLLRSRDLFVHDGTKLRRIRLSAPVQIALLAIAAVMLAWSAFAAAHFLGGEKAAPVAVGNAAQMQQLAAAAEQRARVIEQRQKLLATMLAGGEVDPAKIPETSDTAALPAAIAAPLDRAAQQLAAEEAAAAERLEQRYKVATAELRKLGLSPQRLAVGGPYEPVTKSDPTFKALFNSWKKLDSLQDGVIAVPSDKPVRTAEFTSSFGVRSDPFGRGAAMHAGIDLAGPVGTPIYATADGIVTEATFNSGGYGNLVKLDHGRGIETRYGHLSTYGVRAGDRVKRGQLIGRMGSTGRSTGSHLHYEVRIDGRAVNPVPFMRSTDYLVAIRNRNGHSMDQIAQGGPSRSRR
ncbi:M23 family metallopeptidase [Sphingomonas sp. LHG3406-1]|uniref:M23 family metallopeptidase n=1 Tax=Sphingomonas sp. LHG3406-1 TaxID=2804617 RepID=UPI0026087874|nr:M23 family metallopeptidase [Sphingomonas sp. LHG3406-1]